MAVQLGVSSGFVTVAPTADPNGGATTTIDGSSVVTKDTSPAGATKIVQIGWWRNGTNTANFQIALYANTSDVAAARLYVDATNSSNVNGWITVDVDWAIDPSTAYWLAVQMTAHASSSTIDRDISGGAGYDILTSQTALNDPYGGGAVTDADGLMAIYALVNISSDNQPAYTAGKDTSTGSISAYLNGAAAAIPASGSQPAYTAGVDTATDNQPAYTQGSDTSSDSQPAYLAGQDAAADSQAAYLAGSATSTGSVSAYLSGTTTAQSLMPDSDISQSGGWENELGGSTLYTSLDETAYNDSDYVWYENSAGDEYFEVGLANPSGTPGEGDVTIHFRGKDAAALSGMVRVELREGTTVIASTTEALTGSNADYSYTLTAGEKAAITDWSNLRLRVIVDAGIDQGTLESFEDESGWAVTSDTSGTGSTVARSADFAAYGSYCAKCFTTNASAKAQVRHSSWSSPFSGIGSANPGEHYWWHGYIYVPTATANAITGSEYIDLAGYYVSSTGAGFYLRLTEGAQLNMRGPGDSGQGGCKLWGTMPLDQWVEVEIGLWSQDTGDLNRALAIVVDGKYYGWFTRGVGSQDYDRLAIGIVGTNSADDLTVYVDECDIVSEDVDPAGTDNRPTGNSTSIDYRDQSGENAGYHYTTWEAGNPQLSATYGLSATNRIQSGVNHEKMSSLASGWSMLTINWKDGSTPSWPPVGVGNFFGPMIGFHKGIPVEENLEIVPIYRSGESACDLVYESWTLGASEYAEWQLPMDGSGHRIPGQGDKIYVTWEQTSSTNIRVIVDYYDASADTWYNSVIDDERNLSNVSGVNFLDGDHLAVTNTIDSGEYTIVMQESGTLATAPR